MQYFGYSVNIIFVIVALLLFQRIFLFHVQFVNGMNTSYVQIRNELASEQLIKVQFQVAMSGRYSNHSSQKSHCTMSSQHSGIEQRQNKLVSQVCLLLNLAVFYYRGKGSKTTSLQTLN